jgi:hypothetical protein
MQEGGAFKYRCKRFKSHLMQALQPLSSFKTGSAQLPAVAPLPVQW